MPRRPADTATFDLFEVPSPVAPLDRSHDLDVPLREALNAALKCASKDRGQIAAEMSRLTGREISKYMLDAYTGDSRQDHNFPFRYAAAFEAATESHMLTQLLAAQRGCKLLVGEEALEAELGKIERTEQQLRARKAALKAYLGRKR